MTKRRLKQLIAGVILIGLLAFPACFVIGALVNSTSLTSITVTLKAGGVEHKDPSVMGIGKDETNPDYRLKIRVDDQWIDLGTFSNRKIGNGITFPLKTHVPERRIAEVLLLDNDKIEDDVLEQQPIIGQSVVGDHYRFTLHSQFDIQSGFDWFFATPLGKLIAAGITIAVVIVILLILASIFGSIGG